MLRRRLAAAALAALTAALLAMPGVASGTQAGDQALVRVAHFSPGLLKGDVYVIYVNGRLQLKGVPFKTVSDYLKVKAGKFKVEVREAGEPVSSPRSSQPRSTSRPARPTRWPCSGSSPPSRPRC